MSLAVSKRLCAPLALALITVSMAGCEDEVLGPVFGRVTFQGEPVTAGLVCFQNDELGVHMTAPIDASGNYEVATAKGKGLPLGTYRVFISPQLPELPMGAPDPSMTPPDLSRFPTSYLRPETSGLTFEVQRCANRLDIDMRPR